MKPATIFNLALGLLIIFFSYCLPLSPQLAKAQDSGYVATSQTYSREELTQMLAPIALYPDTLLSQVLMASTYPIEVIEANRWLRNNPGLQGEDLDAALLDKDWSPSVKAICQFPQVLSLMSERITETTNLGNAFLAQEAEVMDVVQELRSKAYAQGSLTTTSTQKVIVDQGKIIIEPSDPRVVYVPYYDPSYVYGPWWYPAYPPYYWGPSGVRIGVGISYWPGFYFGFAFDNWSYFDWHRHYIYLDVRHRPRFVKHDRWIRKTGRWHHDPRHRRGAAYLDKSTARKFGQYRQRPRDLWRDTRGFPEQNAHGQRSSERTRTEHVRQERTRVERARQERTRVERARQERTRTEHVRQERTRVERARQERTKTERTSQQPIRIVPAPQKPEPTRTKHAHREQARVEPDRQVRTGIVIGSQKEHRVKREIQTPKSIIFERGNATQTVRTPEQSRENVFNQVENGQEVRESSERGRTSRQGSRRGLIGGSSSRGSRDNRGRNRH